MLLNYLKLSLRLLLRSPSFTFINVLGLSVGFASFFILWEYSSSELKTDQYHKEFERIGRLGAYWRFPNQEGGWGLLTFGGIRPHQAPSIAADFPQVEQYVRMLMQPEFETDLVGHDSRVVVSVKREVNGEELFEERRMVYADTNLFSFFTIPLVHGEKGKVLRNAHSVVLSEQTARKYFGAKDPTGEWIQINNSVLLLVTGVFEDLPHNTHLAFDLVASMAGIPVAEFPHKLANTYIRVHPKATLEDFNSTLSKNSEKYWEAERKRFPDGKTEMFIQPLRDIAFSAPFERDYLIPKTKSALVLMRFASLLILCMSWINYNNLAASRMMKRMKEIATRKMTGALSSDFAKQFIVESGLVNILSVAVAFTLIQLVRVPFNELFRVNVPEFSSMSYEAWLIFATAIVTGILISGFYPTIMASSYEPQTLFSISRKSASRWVKSLLSTSQYVMALVLILWVYIVYLQLNFILNKDLGIDRDRVVIIDAPIVKSDAYLSEFESFLKELRSLNGIMEATFSATVIGDADAFFYWLKGPEQTGFTTANTNGEIDESFIPFYSIPILAGRNFVSNDKPDVAILSPQASRRLGFARPEDALGQTILVDEFDSQPVQVVGIIDEYRVKPLYNLASTATENSDGIGICLLYKFSVHPWRVPERISVRIESQELDETLARANDVFARNFPGNVFNWYFLDDHINNAYTNDRIVRNQISLFTLIAIGLCCLGLLGMMATIVEEKVKEIGIRKVLGAGAWQVAQRLIGTVILPVFPAIAIAAPIAYYLAEQFLERYMERIALHWWHFAIPVAVLMAMLFSTISSLLWRASNANPVEALKHD